MNKINFHKFIILKKNVYTYFKVFFQLLEINEKKKKMKNEKKNKVQKLNCFGLLPI